MRARPEKRIISSYGSQGQGCAIPAWWGLRLSCCGLLVTRHGPQCQAGACPQTSKMCNKGRYEGAQHALPPSHFPPCKCPPCIVIIQHCRPKTCATRGCHTGTAQVEEVLPPAASVQGEAGEGDGAVGPRLLPGVVRVSCVQDLPRFDMPLLLGNFRYGAVRPGTCRAIWDRAMLPMVTWGRSHDASCTWVWRLVTLNPGKALYLRHLS